MANYTALYQEQDFGDYSLLLVMDDDVVGSLEGEPVQQLFEFLISTGDLWEFVQVHYEGAALGDISLRVNAAGEPYDPA